MPTGAPDYFKRTLLHGVDEDGDPTVVLVDKEGRIIFRAVSDFETATLGDYVTADAGTENVDSPIVPPGELWIVSSIACMNSHSMNSSAQIWLYDGVSHKILRSQNSPAPLESTDWQGSLVMGPGWFIRFGFQGCTQDDVLYWAITYTIVED